MAVKIEGPVAAADGGCCFVSSGVCKGGGCSGIQSILMSYFAVNPVLSITVRPRLRESTEVKFPIGTLTAISSPRPILIPPQPIGGVVPGCGGGGGLVGSNGVQLPSFASISPGPSLPSFLATTNA